MDDFDIPFRTPTILIVDSDPLVRDFLSTVVDDIAMIEEAENGAESLEKARRLQPDLIVLDLALDGLDGFDVCERLKLHPVTEHIPVILMANQASAEREEHGIQIGAADFLTKPLSPSLAKSRIENQLRLARYARELKRLTTTDHQTGLPNERQFMSIVMREFARFKRHARIMSLVVFSIDDYRELIENHGRDIGDHILRETATLLKDAIRMEDTLARTGMATFCMILPDTDIDGAETEAERLRDMIESIEIDTDRTTVRFTASLGVTEVRSDDKTVEETLSRADHAMVEARKAGRNRVEARA